VKKFIFLDTETARLLNEIKPEENIKDIIIQLSYIVIDEEIGFSKPVYVADVQTNPGCIISFTTMTVHHTTQEMLEGRPNVKDTEEYRYLKEMVESGEYVFVAHNANFDAEVLKMVGIDVKKHCEIIDTLRISEIINDQTGLKLEMNKLRYIIYFYGLYKKKQKLLDMYGLSDKNSYHEAISDIVDCILVYLHFKNEFKATNEHMIYLSNNPVQLKYVPFGSNRGKLFEDLLYNSLKWYAETDNPNVAYTAKLYI
jgi:exodeoxyribonuclease X